MSTQTTEPTAIPVEQLKVGDMVDLASCPYLNQHPQAPYMLATVDFVELETPDCIAIGYEGIDRIGYQIGSTLLAVRCH